MPAGVPRRASLLRRACPRADWPCQYAAPDARKQEKTSQRKNTSL